MREVEFQISSHESLAHVESIIESACANEGLAIGMKKPLASYPGSMHWHFTRPGQRGTLEITFDPRAVRIRASVQSRRDAAWIEASLATVKEAIERAFKMTNSAADRTRTQSRAPRQASKSALKKESDA